LIVKASNDLPIGHEIKIDLEQYPEINEALITQRPVVLQDIGSSLLMEPVREKVKELSYNSLIVVPIVKKQNVIGTFFLRTGSPSKGGITSRVFKLCQLIASISGNALENAVLFEAMQSNRKLLQDLNCRDSLTGLFNHQHFHLCLEGEFSRAHRYGLPLSCIFLDVDNFKNINDRYGHLVGDVVLKKIGKVIEQMLRKSDIAARYGGEEFAVILPNTASTGASDFANRLLIMIREMAISQVNYDKITASIGVSTYLDGNMASYNDLLCSADKAMYAAKLLKKDRVCQAS
jgi:two-component system cell cycle response regulator